jgi:SCP-2 sterol transfer family protein
MKTGVLDDLNAVRTESLLRLIGRASRPQLAAVMDKPELRAMALAEFVRRVPGRFRPARGNSLAAVMHCRLSGGFTEDGFDEIQIVIENGSCAAGRSFDRAPHVTITAGPVDLLKAITGRVAASVMLVGGRLSLRGDLRLALRLLRCFDI